VTSIDDRIQLPADRVGDLAAVLLNLVAEVAALSERVAGLESTGRRREGPPAPAKPRADVEELVRRVLSPLAPSVD
jgi:hypothetical protein